MCRHFCQTARAQSGRGPVQSRIHEEGLLSSELTAQACVAPRRQVSQLLPSPTWFRMLSTEVPQCWPISFSLPGGKART